MRHDIFGEDIKAVWLPAPVRSDGTQRSSPSSARKKFLLRRKTLSGCQASTRYQSFTFDIEERKEQSITQHSICGMRKEHNFDAKFPNDYFAHSTSTGGCSG